MLVFVIAVAGLAAAGIGSLLGGLGLLVDGHPSFAGVIYVFGRAWMHFVCPVGVVLGLISIVLSLRGNSSDHWKLLSIWTIANLVQASATSGWP